MDKMIPIIRIRSAVWEVWDISWNIFILVVSIFDDWRFRIIPKESPTITILKKCKKQALQTR